MILVGFWELSFFFIVIWIFLFLLGFCYRKVILVFFFRRRIVFIVGKKRDLIVSWISGVGGSGGE